MLGFWHVTWDGVTKRQSFGRNGEFGHEVDK